MKALMFFGTLIASGQMALAQVKQLHSTLSNDGLVKQALVVSMDVSSGDLTVNRAVRGQQAQAIGYGRIQLRPNEKIIGSQTFSGLHGRASETVMVLTRNLVTNEVSLYEVDQNGFYSSAPVAPERIHTADIPATDKIVGIQLVPQAFRGEMVYVIAIDTAHAEGQRIVVHQIDSSQAQRRDFGPLEMKDSEKIVGASFEPRRGRGSSDLAVIMAVDKNTGLIVTNEASGLGSPIVDREEFGKTNLNPSEKIIGADFLNGAFRHQVRLLAMDKGTGELVTNIADARSLSAATRDGRLGQARLNRVCASLFLTAN